MTRTKHLLALLVGLLTLATLAPVASAANAPDGIRYSAAAPERHAKVVWGNPACFRCNASAASAPEGLRWNAAAQALRGKSAAPALRLQKLPRKF
jgi:hypothetical protein